MIIDNETLMLLARDAGLPVSWWDKALESGEHREWRELQRFAYDVLATFAQRETDNRWITEYPGDVFVVFDPTTDGSQILGATRSFSEAKKLLDSI